MLNDLGIRQKLSVLLTVPLFAVVCTTVPLTVERTDDARAAAAAARLAEAARDVGGLVQDLQRERAVALAFLVLPATDRSAVVTGQRAVDDDVARIRGGGVDAGVALALDRVAALDPQRRSVLAGTAGTVDVYHAYAAAILTLLDALRLTARDGIDAAGLRRLTTLDGLLRADQAAADVDAGLVIAAAEPGAGAPLLAAAQSIEREQRSRLRRFASGEQSALLDVVERGPSSQRVAGLAGRLGGAVSPRGADRAGDVASAVGAVGTYAMLRQGVEDRIVSDIVAAANAHLSRARATASGVGLGAVLVLAIVVGLSVSVSRSIAAPLRRLSLAAGAVADIAGVELSRVADADDAVSRPTRLAAVNIRGQDEIGELASAINRVQATAALLLERQVSTQHNVAVMFANIARRTSSLVARQLSLIDDMERNERDALVLEKLYRLDHLTTRLRRSADSLLVVSGNRDRELVAPTPLVTVIRAGAGEIEGFQAVRLGQVCDVVIAAELVADLRLLLAELLENATAFSPPGSYVEVGAELDDGCRITVMDFGIGMPPARMREENRRIVERPRLDVAPTEVLGLFVVGRLARRHGLAVRLDPTPGQGVTATILLPARLYSVERMPFAQPVAELPAAPEPPDTTFGWFAGPAEQYDLPVAAVPMARAALVDEPPADSRNGLSRRTPGRFATAFETRPVTAEPSGLRDAEAEANQLTAFTQGAARAAADGWDAVPPAPQPDVRPVVRGIAAVTREPHADAPRTLAARADDEPQPGRHGLTRRTPGAHLFASARPNPPTAASAPAGLHRDPEAERAALDDFVEGTARASYRRDPSDRHNGRQL